MSKLLPYETIVKAHEGEPDAVNTVLQHYAGYIRYCSRIYMDYNKDIEDAITSRLIETYSSSGLIDSRKIKTK